MIARVYLKNWKSHHETELTFSEGVNLLVGEMGAGKSSVVEAIIFALYGTTPALQSRRVTLDQVMRRTPTPADECVVEVDIERDDATYTVRREITRNGDTAKTDTSELRKDGDLIEAPQASAVTERVEQLLDIDYDLFSRSIYSEQNQLDYFLTLRAGERKRKVDDLLQLNRFETGRKTLVSLINRLEDRRKNREASLDDLRDDLDDAAIDELTEQQDAAREQVDELAETLEELAERYEDVTETLDDLQDRKETYQDLTEKRTALKTRIESVDEQIAALEEDLGDAAALDPSDVDDRRETLQEEQDALNETKEQIEALEKTLSALQERKEQTEETLEKKQEQHEKLDDLADVTDDLDEQQDALDELKNREQELKTRLQDVKQAMQDMSKAAEECPTCGRELTDDHRVTFLEEKKDEKQKLEAELEEVQDKKEQVAETVDELQEQKDDLLQYKGVDEQIAELEDELEHVNEELSEKKEQLDELREEYTADRVEELDDALDRLDAVDDLHELREEKADRVEQLEQVEANLEELAFDEDELEAVRDRKNEIEKQRDVVQNKIEAKQELIAERAKRLEELEQKQERIDTYEEQIAAYRAKLDTLNQLLKALEGTQVELRNQFINSVNELMDDIWQHVYPYDDYESIRLNASEDYLLQVRDVEGNWISVDGEVSGGERHSAALTLRIALSILLTPTWRLLILDEPTHNLDVTAIEELAETLRTEVSDIVGQLFLITHEERLETAVTGELYKLSKTDADTGLTTVDPVTGE